MYRALRSAFATTAAATIAITVVSGIGGVIAARALGPYERGLLAAAVAWSFVLGSLIAYAVPQAGTYFVAREPVHRARYLSTLLVMGAVAGGGIAILGVVGSLLFVKGDAAEPLAIAFATQLPVIVVSVQVGAILGLEQYRAWGLFRVLGPAIALVGIIAAVTVGLRTAVAIASVYAAATTVQAGVLLVALRRRNLVGKPSRAVVASILSYVWRNVVSVAVWQVSYRIDQLFLSLAVAPQLLGIYAVSASFSEVIVPVAASAGSVMLARVSAGGERAIRASLPRALASSLLLAGVFCVGTFVAAPLAISVLFGDDFLPGVTSLRILLVGAVGLAVSSVLAETLIGLGRPLTAAKAQLIGAIPIFILLPVLVPRLGIEGAALASTASYAITTLAIALYLRREMRPST